MRRIPKQAMFSYNTSVHESTLYSPHELIFGKAARSPSSDPPIENNLGETYKEYLTDLFNRIRTTQELARRNLDRSKIRSKYYYDKRINPQQFRIGDKVYLLKKPNKGKLGDQYVGPYELVEILSNNNVKIRINEK